MNGKKRQCIVITAYKDPKQLETLIDIFQESFYIYIHVDKKVWSDFEYLKKTYPNIHISSEYSVNWGSMEHLMSILHLLETSLEKEWEYVHLISGEDFPVVRSRKLLDYFEGDDKIYVAAALPKDGRWWKYYWLYTYKSQNYKNKWIRLLNLFIVACQCVLPFMNKKRLGEFSEIYQGLVWGTYPRYAIEYVMNYINEHNEFLQELKWCKIPEEICFQTILMNSKYRDKVVNNNLRYMKMEIGDWGPDYLSEQDIKEMNRESFLFCRKVKSDSSVQRILLDAIMTENVR